MRLTGLAILGVWGELSEGKRIWELNVCMSVHVSFNFELKRVV